MDEDWLLQQNKRYIEIEKNIEKTILKLSDKLSIKYVATNEVHYANENDWLAHEILLNVKAGLCRITKGSNITSLNPKRKVMFARDFHFKTEEEMTNLFSDLPLAISNSLKIAEKCNTEISFSMRHYPKFPLDSEKNSGQYLYDICKKNIEKRYPKDVLEELFPGQNGLKKIHEKLDYEYETIFSKNLTDYLLIVADFINWAKSKGIAVGPGRGSGSGSIICYLLQITDIDPIRFGLFFERFLNPERPSYPDIDVDICMERRHEVINYMSEKYGHDKIAHIITFSTMKAKLVVKDVSRTLGIPLSTVNKIVKWIDDTSEHSLKKAIDGSIELQNAMRDDPSIKTVIDMSLKLEGLVRGTSTHAAGIIVCIDPLINHVPLCVAKDSNMMVTQFHMKPVEKVGMLKIDFLGLKTLTVIQKTVEIIKKSHNVEIDWTNLPLDDKATFQTIGNGKTSGIFQLESTGMTDLVKKLKVDAFPEIVAIISLYRPGPMAMIPSFIARKHKEEAVITDHPLLEPILAETYGHMVYQEQVITIAQILAGYTLGQADLFRKAMGKKDHAEMLRQREKFISGALEKGISEEVATKIFDKIEKFAAYAFNKAHAAAYAYITYTTAYLKTHYASEFFAALMTIAKDDLKKVTKLIEEAIALNIKVFLPDINHADLSFSAGKDGIYFGLAGIKGIGENIVKNILIDRNKKGLFKTFPEAIERLSSLVHKKSFEILIQAGSFDSLGWNRDQMLQSYEILYDDAIKKEKEQQQGTLVFQFVKEDAIVDPPDVIKETPLLEKLFIEKSLLGVYLTASPLDLFKEKIKQLPLKSISSAIDKKEQFALVATIIDDIDFKTSQNNSRFAKMKIINDDEYWDIMAFSHLCDKYESLLKPNKLLLLAIKIDNGDRLGLQALDIWDIQQLDDIESIKSRYNACIKKSNYKKASKMSKIELTLDIDAIDLSDIVSLKTAFLGIPGKSKLDLIFKSGNEIKGVISSQLMVDYEKLKTKINKPWLLKLSLLQ